MNHTLDCFKQKGNFEDLRTEHAMDVSIPERRRFRCGESIPSLPQHGMCSGSSGGIVDDMVGINTAVATCNACGTRVRIDNL